MAITAGRDRILLATLLLHAGRVVDHATLAEALWGIGPPPTARSQLQICVSRLRHRLPPETIASDPAGAIIRPTSDRLYEVDFSLDLATTRGSAGDRVGALELYRRALQLAREHGMAYLAARAEAGVAECLADTDPEQAHRLRLVALAAFREMGVPGQYGVKGRPAA